MHSGTDQVDGSMHSGTDQVDGSMHSGTDQVDQGSSALALGGKVARRKVLHGTRSDSMR